MISRKLSKRRAIITKIVHIKNVLPYGLTSFSFTCGFKWEVGQCLSKRKFGIVSRQIRYSMMVPHPKKRKNVSFCINSKIFEEWFIEWAITTKLLYTKNVSPSCLTNFSFNCCCEWEVGQWLSKTVLMDQ